MKKSAAKSKPRNARTTTRQGVSSSIALVRDGWAVVIDREDGSSFFSAGMIGVETPLWPNSQRFGAVAHKRDLIKMRFDARVVRVRWTPPMIVPNASDAGDGEGKTMKTKPNVNEPLPASGLLCLGDVSMPCHFCKQPRADTCFVDEVGVKWWWHERCNALSLMKAESHFQNLTVDVFGKRCKPWEKIDFASKSIRRAKRLSRHNNQSSPHCRESERGRP